MSESDPKDEPVSGFSVFLVHAACLVGASIAVSFVLGIIDLLFSGFRPEPAFGASLGPGLYFGLILLVLGALPLAIYSFFYSAYADHGEATYRNAAVIALASVTAACSLTFLSSGGFEGNLMSFLVLVSFGYPVAVPIALMGHYFCKRFLIHKPNPSFNGRRGEPQ